MLGTSLGWVVELWSGQCLRWQWITSHIFGELELEVTFPVVASRISSLSDHCTVDPMRVCLLLWDFGPKLSSRNMLWIHTVPLACSMNIICLTLLVHYAFKICSCSILVQAPRSIFTLWNIVHSNMDLMHAWLWILLQIIIHMSTWA